MHLARRSPLLPAALCLSGLLVLASAAAQDNPLEVAAGLVPPRTGNPLDPDPVWVGVWADEARGVGIMLLPHPSQTDACEGLILTIRRDGHPDATRDGSYELTGKVTGERVEGTFKVQAKEFPFSATVEGASLTLVSGKATYRLPRVREAGSSGRLRRKLTDLRVGEGRGGPDGNEAAAIGALKTLVTAQTLFREGDKEGDGVLDYGTLTELSRATLVDAVLGGGKKSGYVFDCQPSAATPEFLWFATASPAEPGTTGRRYFATNHAGVIYYSTERPFVIDGTSCAMPEGATPVGK